MLAEQDGAEVLPSPVESRRAPRRAHERFLVSYLVGLSVGRNPRVSLDAAVAISLGRDPSR
jgi:hypothetical protein